MTTIVNILKNDETRRKRPSGLIILQWCLRKNWHQGFSCKCIKCSSMHKNWQYLLISVILLQGINRRRPLKFNKLLVAASRFCRSCTCWLQSYSKSLIQEPLLAVVSNNNADCTWPNTATKPSDIIAGTWLSAALSNSDGQAHRFRADF